MACEPRENKRARHDDGGGTRWDYNEFGRRLLAEPGLERMVGLDDDRKEMMRLIWMHEETSTDTITLYFVRITEVRHWPPTAEMEALDPDHRIYRTVSITPVRAFTAACSADAEPRHGLSADVWYQLYVIIFQCGSDPGRRMRTIPRTTASNDEVQAKIDDRYVPALLEHLKHAEPTNPDTVNWSRDIPLHPPPNAHESKAESALRRKGIVRVQLTMSTMTQYGTLSYFYDGDATARAEVRIFAWAIGLMWHLFRDHTSKDDEALRQDIEILVHPHLPLLTTARGICLFEARGMCLFDPRVCITDSRLRMHRSHPDHTWHVDVDFVHCLRVLLDEVDPSDNGRMEPMTRAQNTRYPPAMMHALFMRPY